MDQYLKDSDQSIQSFLIESILEYSKVFDSFVERANRDGNSIHVSFSSSIAALSFFCAITLDKADRLYDTEDALNKFIKAVRMAYENAKSLKPVE